MKKKQKILFSLVILSMVSMLARPGTTLAEEKKAAAASPEVLATVGDRKITQADIDAKTSLMPPQFRARYETPEGKQKLLEHLVKFTLHRGWSLILGTNKITRFARD